MICMSCDTHSSFKALRVRTRGTGDCFLSRRYHFFLFIHIALMSSFWSTGRADYGLIKRHENSIFASILKISPAEFRKCLQQFRAARLAFIIALRLDILGAPNFVKVLTQLCAGYFSSYLLFPFFCSTKYLI